MCFVNTLHFRDNHTHARTHNCSSFLTCIVESTHRGKPWIIEVNEMPSFDTSAPIDAVVKCSVITETLQMVSPTVQEARLLNEPSGARTGGLTDNEERRRTLYGLRLQQEMYYAKKFRRIYPLREGEGHAEEDGLDEVWDFLSVPGQRVNDMEKEYAECARASAEIFEDSLWLKLGKGTRAEAGEKKKGVQVCHCTVCSLCQLAHVCAGVCVYVCMRERVRARKKLSG